MFQQNIIYKNRQQARFGPWTAVCHPRSTEDVDSSTCPKTPLQVWLLSASSLPPPKPVCHPHPTHCQFHIASGAPKTLHSCCVFARDDSSSWASPVLHLGITHLSLQIQHHPFLGISVHTHSQQFTLPASFCLNSDNTRPFLTLPLDSILPCIFRFSCLSRLPSSVSCQSHPWCSSLPISGPRSPPSRCGPSPPPGSLTSWGLMLPEAQLQPDLSRARGPGLQQTSRSGSIICSH